MAIDPKRQLRPSSRQPRSQFQSGPEAKAMPPKAGISTEKHLLAGGLAGGLEITLMYPTEFIKTQLQLQRTAKVQKYSGVIDCARKVVAERGVFALYRGLSSLLVGTIPKTSVRFTTFNTLKGVLAEADGSTTLFNTWLAGALTGLVESGLVVIPVETMKTKLIHDQNSPEPRFKGLLHGVRTIVAEEGIAGIYRGVAPTIAKQMGNQGIRFVTYDGLKKAYRASQGTDTPAAWTPVFGAAAGTISVLLTMPFDVVKTRMQEVHVEYKGTVDCVRRIMADEGIFAFWKGTLARLPRVAVGQSITLAGYDQIVKVIDKMW